MRSPGRPGSPPGCSGSARPRCSTTCSCSAASSAPARTRAPTTSPMTDGRDMDLTETGWQYAPAPESRDIVTIAPQYGLFVAGEFRPAADGGTFATINTASAEPLRLVAE